MENFFPFKIARARWLSTVTLAVILLTAAFLRLYKIADYMTFLGDEGRDVLVVKHILDGHLVGLGPTASVGGFFTGPIYYYFMAPFLWFFHLDPVGPAYMVGLFGTATVFLVYLAGKIFFNEKAGLVGAALYAVSPLVLGYSRSSWNPNLMPFFTLLSILVLYKAVTKKNWWFFLATGVFYGIALQLHYIETFFGVTIILYILLAQSKKLYILIKSYALLFFGFLIGLLPFLAFELKHGFPNTMSVIKFIFGNGEGTGFDGNKFLSTIWDVLFRIFSRLLTRFPPSDQLSQLYHDKTLLIGSWGFVTIIILFGSLIAFFYAFKKSQKEERLKYLLLALWLGVGIFLFGFYKKPIYDYYFEFMFPLPFLLVGNLFSFLYDEKKFKLAGKLVAAAGFIWLLFLNLDGVPFKYTPNRQLAQVRSISEFVLEKAEGKPFNFALITNGNSDHAYRYFFELEGNSPATIENTEIDPQRKSVTQQLLIVCEDPNCHPLGHSLWEVAGFGRAEIAGEWNVSVVKVFKLVHYEGKD